MTAGAPQSNRPVELLEESLQLLRGAATPVLLEYWTGSLPFAIALLWIERDAGHAWGSPLLLRDSLCCAFAFVWLNYWRSRASVRLFSILSPGAEHSAGWFQRASLQLIFQTLKLLVMPFAAASILAWPAASAFFRTLTLEPISGERAIRGAFQRALASARWHYAENALAFLAIAALAFVAWLNLTFAIGSAPFLWKLLTGYETDWSRLAGATFLSLLSISAAGAWLLLDPWIQTYCLLRVFYQNARTDGRDLLRNIARLAAVALFCVLSLTPTLRAEQPPNQQSLNQSIERASQDREYAWLRPDDNSAQQGFLNDLAKKANDGIHATGRWFNHWYQALLYWLRELLHTNNPNVDEKHKIAPPISELRWMLAIAGILICGIIVALFLRRPKRAQVTDGAAAPNAAQADVLNEQILPSDVSQEEWLRLAGEYLASGQTRLAARAFYLANLSYLGSNNLLSLSLSKSNSLYERELKRQPNSARSLAAFSAANRLYERAWYGMRELAADQMDALQTAVAQLRQHA